MNEHELFAALSNRVRREILRALRDPRRHFTSQVESDPADGVCVSAITAWTGLSQSTVSAYMAALERAGLVTSERRAQWTYFKRSETGVERLRTVVTEEL